MNSTNTRLQFSSWTKTRSSPSKYDIPINEVFRIYLNLDEEDHPEIMVELINGDALAVDHGLITVIQEP